MWTTKTFIRKTKRGNILKIIREHYLRDDLLCGSEACKVCPHREDEFVLEAEPESICALYDYPHYLVLDTNVVLHQIDVLEENVLMNIIILQTVLEEVKHQNAAVFQRLLEIINSKKRKFYSFVNEHHKDTYVERLPGEKANDRNDRAIRKACLWYSSHLTSANLAKSCPKILLLTDDEQNRSKAQEEGITCCTVKDYVTNIGGFPGLQDKLSKNVIPEFVTKDALYPAHLTPSEIQAGIRAKKFYQGKFYSSRDNYLEGSVNVDGFENGVLVLGHSGINRAVDGDQVAIEIFPKEEWRRPTDVVLEDTPDDPGDTIAEETEVLNSAKPKSKEDDEVTPTGRVVGIIRRKWRQYCGILLPSKFPGATRHLFIPAEKRIPRVRIETRQSDVLASQRILVALDSWPRNSRYPLGHFVRALGPIGDKEAENEVLLLEHDVPHARFSEAVLACLPPADYTIPQQEIEKRVDLRGICICSVDPPGCTDIDDALHARPLAGRDDGAYEVGVHIADVTHFVRPGTALDSEAALRSTTVYLVDRRIDMVPDLLSSNLCSLRGGEERLAFSCVWVLDQNANVLSTKFHKSVIKSAAAMTYEEAQIAIDDSRRQDDVASSLRILNTLAKKLKKKRLDNGALLLASPEIRFQVDSETHDPIEVETKRLMDTNSMVEEFMLLANVSVAERLAAEFPQCALLRRHPSPPAERFTVFIKAAKQQGFDIDVTTNASFSKSLDKAVIPGRPYFNTLLRIMATRCMMQAVYFSSGSITKDNYHHYGLACPIYTHFTSPIRRYADVMVHRLLAACIGADVTHASLLDSKLTESICDNLNYRHRQAQYAGRASVALNTHILFKSRVSVEQAVVLMVKRNALQVLVPKYGLEGPLYLPPELFSYNEQEHYQTCGDTKLKTFDEITIRLSLDSSNLQHRKLVFQLVEPKIQGFSVSAAIDTTDNVENTGEKMELDEGNCDSKFKGIGSKSSEGDTPSKRKVETEKLEETKAISKSSKKDKNKKKRK